jgi:DNA-binding beta-propeller fold protein YncE
MNSKLLALLLLPSFLIGQAAEPLHLVKEIPLPGVQGRIDHLSVDVQHGRLFVSALGNNTVEIVDIQQGKRVNEVTGLKAPQGVLYLAKSNRIFVASDGDGTVQSFDADTLAHLKTAQMGEDADNLRYDGASGLIWVGYGSGGLASFDTDLNRKATIGFPVHPESFQLEPNTARIFVNLPGRLKIAVVDRSKDSVAANWQTHGALENFPMALDTEDKRLFVGCRLPARMLILDSDSGKTVGKVPIVGDTDDLFFDAARRSVYIIGGEGAVTVIRLNGADRYEQVSKTPTAPGAPGQGSSSLLLTHYSWQHRIEVRSRPGFWCMRWTTRVGD